MFPGPDEELPLSEETLARWLKDAGASPGKDYPDAALVLRQIDRAILANDPDIDFSTRKLTRTRSGSRGSSGQSLPGVAEGLAVFWVLVGVIGCVVIVKRHGRQVAEA